MRISISDGNTKMGKVPSVSLTPCVSCAKDAPCRKRCYILKAFRMYEATRKAYRSNLTAYRRNPSGYFAAIDAYLNRKQSKYFRFHVGGDCPDAKYMLHVVAMASKHPNTTFLLFTKRYQWVSDIMDKMSLPSNLSIVLSAWPGYDMHNPHGLPVAWMQDGTETRVPDTALPCPGNCETCGLCFKLAATGCDVVFNAH